MELIMTEDPDRRIWQRQNHRRQLDSLGKWLHIFIQISMPVAGIIFPRNKFSIRLI